MKIGILHTISLWKFLCEIFTFCIIATAEHYLDFQVIECAAQLIIKWIISKNINYVQFSDKQASSKTISTKISRQGNKATTRKEYESIKFEWSWY